MKVRFSERLSVQTLAAEGEVHLSEPISVHDLILALYMLFPGLLANVAGRANPEVIERRLRLTVGGRPVRLTELVGDQDLLMVADRAEVEGV